MKSAKTAPLLFLMACALVLPACGQKPLSLEDRISQIPSSAALEESYEGRIEKAALSAYQEGTHRILDEDGEHLLQSSLLDLNQYLGKKVIVSGVPIERIGNAKPVLEVSSVRLTEDSFDAPFSDYRSEKGAFSLSYPQSWQLAEGASGISLQFGQEPWAWVDVFADISDFKSFVASRESSQGAEVTVAAQPALRFNDSESFRIYLAHPSAQKAYLIRFGQEQLSSQEKRPVLYRILDSFRLTYSPAAKAEPCGGAEDLACAEGYRCDLKDNSEHAEGICVSLQSGTGPSKCPFISPPAGCLAYRVSQYSENSCPSRYECLPDGLALFESLPEPAPSGADPSQADKPSELEQAKPVAEPTLSAPPAEPEAGPLPAPAQSDSGSASEPAESAPSPVAPLQEASIVDDSAEVPASLSAPLSSGDLTRSYQSIHRGFSVSYHKNWYFSSFGPQEGSEWLVGFSDKALESPSDSLITLTLSKQQPPAPSPGKRLVSKKLDGLFYAVEGPSGLQETIQAMLDSVQMLPASSEVPASE